MKNCIYYFSGTGNSLQAARDLANGLADCDVLSIPKILNKELKPNYERIGIVFPVYAWGPPLIISKFISQLNNINKDSYIFVVTTYRNEPGAVLEYISKALKRQGLELHAGFGVSMPGNHIAHYEADSEQIQKKKFEKWNLQLSEIIFTLLNKNEISYKKPSLFSRFFQTGLLYRIASRQFPKFDANFVSSDKCNGCRMCEKVCPVGNIAIENTKPIWEHKCELGKERYKNPHIFLKDMII